ncbi:uncharacterized protein LOC129573805 [Sitodiplosis mosellana]|uniref:uncharacterized protein LOC129573805 n=1 Tax=Sitodiplosis mosellana TaxID=263140 RepID=UPI0024449AAF|nr:uncharacterized protein LOC129573805 [Sitodiplosis mosellana]
METFAELNALYFTKQTLKILEDNEIRNERMLCQCYDGAAVMNGENGGVQRLIQDELKRKIPYFHCLNHQFHLVIIKAIESVQLVKQFFDQAKLIAKFFRRHKVKQHYEGHSILKLIETRWVGHLRASKSIYESYVHIMNTLPQITGAAGFDGDDVALAAGLYNVMAPLEFVFVLIFMKDLLQTIEPVTKQLQGREIGYKDSMVLIRVVYTTIEKMRTEDNFGKYNSQATNLLRKLGLTESALAASRPIRNRRQSTMLKDSVVEETLGHCVKRRPTLC